MMLTATTKDEKTPSESASASESLLSVLHQPCRLFSFAELRSATGTFDKLRCIGRGGFGKVYIGMYHEPTNIYAIKRLHSISNQGSPEFWVEVKMLSRLRHCNLVSLVGYCNEGKENVLVYEYMHLGSLYDHLHKKGTVLTWSQRLKICLGAARGLDYLHTGIGTQHGIIHRDVKSSNILLDQNYTSKISDFGLAKIGPTNQSLTHVSTMVKGSFGYMDPNYFYTGKLTIKSDVYAFGVVLLEVLCGRPALDEGLDEGLAVWAQDRIKQGKLDQIIDSTLREQISKSCLKEFSRLAVRCLSSHPSQRPTMSEVIGSLNLALSFQERKVSPSQGENLTKKVSPFRSLKGQVKSKETNWFKAILEIVTVPVPAMQDQKANNDLLPAIVSLKITGFTFIGGELQVTRYCINGAVSCMFHCFHHFSNGSSQYIVGATDPTYYIAFDDAGTYIGVEVVPIDKNGRKGIGFKCSPNHGLVKVVNIPFPVFLPKLVDETEPLEVHDDRNDPLPAIDNLQIVGDAFPGGELQVSGMCINGTVFCLFQWARHLSDGSIEYIKGAIGPNYTVVLGDVGTYLGVEVAPMDKNRRYGICYKCFANDGLLLTYASR